MGLSTKNVFIEIKKLLKIEKVAERYTELKQSGKGKLKGLSPFQNEKTPSFVVDLDRQLFYCFSTKQGGDVLNLISIKENIPIEQLPPWINNVYNLNLDLDKYGKSPTHQKQLEALDTFVKFFSEKNKTIAENYVKDRIRNFKGNFDYKLFYITKEDMYTFIESIKNTPNCKNALKELNILTEKTLDNLFSVYTERVIFPVSQHARIVGLNGRYITEPKNNKLPKYFLSASGEIFFKSRLLWGIEYAREIAKHKHIDYVYVTEGVLDAISLLENDIPAVCVLGSSISEEQFKLLHQNFSSVYIAFDNEPSNAGNNGVYTSLYSAFSSGVQLSGYTVKLPNKENEKIDVTDYLNTNSIESFLKLPILSFEDMIINHYIRKTKELVSDPENVNILKEKFLQNILKDLYDYKSNEFSHNIIMRVCERLALDPTYIRNVLDLQIDILKTNVQKTFTVDTNIKKASLGITPVELKLINIISSFPRYYELVVKKDWYPFIGSYSKKLIDIILNTNPEEIGDKVKEISTSGEEEDEFYRLLMMIKKYDNIDIIEDELNAIDLIMGLRLQKDRTLRLMKFVESSRRKVKIDKKELNE